MPKIGVVCSRCLEPAEGGLDAATISTGYFSHWRCPACGWDNPVSRLPVKERRSKTIAVTRIDVVMATDKDYDNSPADIVADVMRWCEARGLDFDREVLSRAYDYIAAEDVAAEDCIEEETQG